VAFAEFTGDRSTASWLLNAAYAADWRAFQRDGKVAPDTDHSIAPVNTRK
jgi:hypothetical protein